MHAVIGEEIGRVHHAVAHPSLMKTRPTYVFIPEKFFGENGLEKSRYIASRWPGINCGANPFAVGSHVIPDSKNPVSIRSRCPILAEFLRRLEIITNVKNITVSA